MTTMTMLKQALTYMVQNRMEPTPANYAYAYRAATSETAANEFGRSELVLFSQLLGTLKSTFPENAPIQVQIATLQKMVALGGDLKMQMQLADRLLTALNVAGPSAVMERAETTAKFRASVEKLYVELERALTGLDHADSVLPGYAERMKNCKTMADAASLLVDLTEQVGALSSTLRTTSTALQETRQCLAETDAALCTTKASLSSAEKRAADSLAAAHTDPLSGVNNRRGLEAALLQLPEGPTSVLALDIDNFKKVNDTLGHGVGDIVIKGLAQTLKGVARPSDIVARVGGEELLIVLPGLRANQTKVVTDRVLSAIRAWNETPEAKAHGLSITVSGGVSSWIHPRANILPVFKNACDVADKFLYKAKEAGKNRIYSADDF